MSEVRKFLFENDFEAPPPPPPEPETAVEEELPPPPPPPPTFSEAELAAAREQAHAEGLAEGIRQGRTEALDGQGHLLNQLLGQIKAQLATLLETQLNSYAETQDRTVQIALTIARKLLPDYAAKYGLGEIESTVRQCLTELGGEPRLVIRTSDALLDAVTKHMTEQAEQQGFAGKLVFLADLTMGPGDCRVEWADGGLERDEARLWAEIDRALAHALRPAPANKPDAGTGSASTTIES